MFGLTGARGLRVSCTYTNTGSENVGWGTDASDEMCTMLAYVTGPHIGTSLDRGIYSSTDDPHEASTFTRADAGHLVRTKGRGLHPEVLPAPPYDPPDH